MRVDSGAFILSIKEAQVIAASSGNDRTAEGYIFFDGSWASPRVFAKDGATSFSLFGDSSTGRLRPFLVKSSRLKEVIKMGTSDGYLEVDSYSGKIRILNKHHAGQATEEFDVLDASNWIRGAQHVLVGGEPDNSKEETNSSVVFMDSRLFDGAANISRLDTLRTVTMCPPGLNSGDSSTMLLRAMNREGGYCTVSFDVQADVPSRDWFSVNGDPRIGGLGQIASGERVKPSAQKAPARPRAQKAPSATAPRRDLHAEMLELLGIGRYEDAAKVKTAITGVAISPEDIDLLHQLDAAGLVNESADLRAALFLE